MKYLLILLILATNSAFAMTYQQAEVAFHKLTESRRDMIKEGSKPFFLGQGKKARTVVMLHGLSDSPGSMVEIAKVYHKKGYNVVTILLRDHGLKEEFRKKATRKIRLKHWREDVDNLMKIAFELSNTNKVALAGYSMGGALAIDTADRYENRISSIVMIAPMFRMKHWCLTPFTLFLKFFIHSTKKGIAETPHFYPDIALNQTYYASKLARQLQRKVTKRPKESLVKIRKMMFLTDADTTIKNDYALEIADKLNSEYAMYIKMHPVYVVLHRDLPMERINASNQPNPFLEDMTQRLDNFLLRLTNDK